MEYLLRLAIFICFNTLLAQSLNLAAGKAGLVSLSHAGFYGIGAYMTALLTLHFGFFFWLNLPIAILISGSIAFLISLVVLRTVEDYFESRTGYVNPSAGFLVGSKIAAASKRSGRCCKPYPAWFSPRDLLGKPLRWVHLWIPEKYR